MIRLKFDGVLPSIQHTSLFCDYIELLVISGKEDSFSQTDVASLMAIANKNEADLLNVTDDDIDDDDEDDELDLTTQTSKKQSKIEDCFRLFEYRSSVLNALYPFSVERGVLRLRNDFKDRNRDYCFLLVCAHLSWFQKSPELYKLPTDFEYLCSDCMKKLVPDDAETRLFGPNTSDRKNFFGNNLKNAIPALAKFMGVKTSLSWNNKNGAKTSTSGDGGIDIVSAMVFDKGEGSLVVIGQCAASSKSEYWSRKFEEADVNRLRDKFEFIVPPLGILFTPDFFRDSSGQFIYDFSRPQLLFDRLRILKNLPEKRVYTTKYVELT